MSAIKQTATLVAVIVCVVCQQGQVLAQRPDIQGKVVLANLDRYNVVIRAGTNPKANRRVLRVGLA